VNDGTFRIWFEPTVGLGFVDGAFVVAVSSEFAKDWMTTRFQALIDDALAETVGDTIPCRLVVDPGLVGGNGSLPEGEVQPPAGQGTKAAGGGGNLLTDDPTFEAPRPFIPVEDRRPVMPPVGLNEKYTFESFVIGPSNRFAHAAALAAAETPGSAYNPLFIYGGVGLGKTHLLQAVGHYVARHSPELRVRFVTMEMFVNDFINSLRDGIEGFKNRYRTNDVLLIDDVQFLQGKEQTQEEFFHTFNALYEAGKQIVISSDSQPKQLSGLQERLVSRFECGLTTDVQAPDLETRIAILRKKVRRDGIRLVDDDVLAMIASRVPTNIRELEGCLTRVFALSSFSGRPVDLGLAREALKDIPEVAETQVTLELILSTVTAALQVSVQEIKGDKRTREIVRARHIVMYLTRELTDLSLPKIGERLGGRDHTTVMHGVKSVNRQMNEDRALYDLIQRLTTTIKQAR